MYKRVCRSIVGITATKRDRGLGKVGESQQHGGKQQPPQRHKAQGSRRDICDRCLLCHVTGAGAGTHVTGAGAGTD